MLFNYAAFFAALMFALRARAAAAILLLPASEITSNPRYEHREILPLIYEMIRRDVHRGIAALCLGGGNAVAMAVER